MMKMNAPLKKSSIKYNDDDEKKMKATLKKGSTTMMMKTKAPLKKASIKYSDDDENESSFEEGSINAKAVTFTDYSYSYLTVAYLSLVSNHLDGDAGVIVMVMVLVMVLVILV